MWSYWLGFYIVDYIKLIIFTILLVIPLYFATDAAFYFGLDMLAINFSSLSFIYFISFFGKKDDEGTKILFLIVFGFFILVTILLIFLGDTIFKYVSSFTQAYIPNIFDLTPISSMALSFFRIIISYSFQDSNGLDKLFKINIDTPSAYLITSYIAQLLNLLLYTLLLISCETGFLQKIIHFIQLRLFGGKEDYVFGQMKISEDFEYNLSSPLLGPQVQQNIQMQNPTDGNIINTTPTLINNPPPSAPLINNRHSNILNPLDNPYVQKEIAKVNGTKELTTCIAGLKKTFFVCCKCCGGSHVRAINNLYLGLEPNEKFGLLGFNGSGKTTTFKAITNEILTDAGTITLFGYDSKRQFQQIRTIIGYCPQINPLFDFMKVKEIIKFYSELKECNESVESICEKFGLGKYLNTYTVNLSGGNKRKLTFAIAMMNRPRLLLLDEPSTGVDPESRRIMWKNINELSNSGHKYNMILTTHSMEEAEVLCDTVSWLKAGNFVTLGNPEELKIQYSAGYKLHIKFDDLLINSNNNLGSDLINDTYNVSTGLIDGISMYSNYFMTNPRFEPYLRNLNEVVQKIKDKTQKISISLIGKDFSFELILSIIKERQKELFIDILTMKNNDKVISEMSIAMQSLENILTSLN
jgi:ABC-type multidrug transport system ATPase subunit